MKQHLAELLTLTVSKCYGELHASIFAQLTTIGRCTLSKLIQKCEGNPAQTRSALVVLIKHQLVVHSTDNDGIPYYEPHLENTYNTTIRSGSLIRFVEERFSDKDERFANQQVADVFETILRSGVVKVEDLFNTVKDHYAALETAKVAKHDSPPSERGLDNDDSGVSGVSAVHVTDKTPVDQPDLPAALNKLRESIMTLSKSGLIEYIGPNQFMPAHDLAKDVAVYVMDSSFSKGVTGKEQRAEYHQVLDRTRRDWRDSSHSHFTNDWPQIGTKRARSPDEEEEVMDTPATKRQKGNNRMSAAVTRKICSKLPSSQKPLENELLVRINFEKCNVALRNQQLVRMASRYVGETTSKVYEALLCVMEGKVLRCFDQFDRDNKIFELDEAKKAKSRGGGKKGKGKVKEVKDELKEFLKEKVKEEASHQKDAVFTKPDPDERQPLIKVDEVNQMLLKLFPELDVNIGLHEKSLSYRISGQAKEKDTETERLQKVQDHLRLLSVDRRGFVRMIGHDCQVPYATLTRTLIDTQIEDSVTARLGMLPARIIRTLNPDNVGMLDEAQLMEYTMVTQKEIRPAILHLQQAGFLRMQEIPKDTTRATARLVWTYKFDIADTRQQLLSDTYKAMARMLQRLDFERVKRQSVIDKSERTDVIGNEDKYLTVHEKEVLSRWKEVEGNLLRQVHRMDELVACMRDFSGMEPFPG